MVGLAIIARIVSNPLANVFQKQLTARGKHPLAVNFFTYLGLGVVCLAFVFGISWNELPVEFWTYSLVAGMLGAVGNGFLVKALQTGDLSVLGPVNAYKSIVGIITGIFLLGEMPNIWGTIGIVLIIWGSYFVLDTTEERFSWKLLKRKDIQFRILAMILTGVEAVFVKKVILTSSPLISFISWCWFGAFFSFLLLLIYRLNIKQIMRQSAINQPAKYLYLLICIGVMSFTTIYVFEKIAVGYALSLFQLSIIVSVLLGHRVFREKDIGVKLIGSAIMIIGSVLIILRT